MTKEDGFRYEASLFGVLFATEDQKEGMGAFVESGKRSSKANKLAGTRTDNLIFMEGRL